MSKTDKELAVELAIATINANPRTKYTTTTAGLETVVPSYEPKAITGLLEGYYSAISQLGSTQAEQS